MKDTTAEQKKAARLERWRERVAAQHRSGFSVKQFCEQEQIAEQSFYFWRKRLRERVPMRFALVETEAVRLQAPADPALELLLVSGERLRIGTGVDPTTLRSVLEALRA
jgi:hypothetical protein